jgi:hypothetical protein
MVNWIGRSEEYQKNKLPSTEFEKGADAESIGFVYLVGVKDCRLKSHIQSQITALGISGKS